MNAEKIMHEEEISFELDLGEPSSELTEYAREYVGENPDTKVKCIQVLRDLIIEKGECTPPRTDDSFLLRFLRARYFVPERAHRLLVNYCTFKKDNPQYHEDVEPFKLTTVGDDDVLTIPPYREQTGRRIMIHKIGKWDPNMYSIDELFKTTLFVLELGILEPRAQILGGIVIFDLENLNMSHLWQITPTVASHVVQLLGANFPMKLHSLHIINEPWIFNKIYNVFKPFVHKTVEDKIHFHGDNFESLHKHIDPSFLPKIYGGTKLEYPYILWLESLSKNKKVIEELLSVGYKINPNDLPFSAEEHEKKKLTKFLLN